MKERLIRILKYLLGFYVIICLLLYFIQEKLIFFPHKIGKEYSFEFSDPYEELNIRSYDSEVLNGLLFKADNSKGLIFYLHGNAGSLQTWGNVARTYTALDYDVFILDYRGYGKSEGSIDGEDQLFQDNQVVYDELRKRYQEENIVILGYSIGTGLAARLASSNSPRLLILQAPYYSLTDMMRHTYRIIPTFILKYKFATSEYLKSCAMPVVIFHGDQDEVIYYGSSKKLESEFKKQDTLITLPGQGHNGMTDNNAYRSVIKEILLR